MLSFACFKLTFFRKIYQLQDLRSPLIFTVITKFFIGYNETTDNFLQYCVIH